MFLFFPFKMYNNRSLGITLHNSEAAFLWGSVFSI